GLGGRGRGGEAIDEGGEATLEELQQQLAGDALGAVGHREVAAELPLEHAVDPAELLLLTQLDRVLRELRTCLTMLPGRIVAALDGAFVGVAPLALQEEFQTLSPAEPARRRRVP